MVVVVGRKVRGSEDGRIVCGTLTLAESNYVSYYLVRIYSGLRHISRLRQLIQA